MVSDNEAPEFIMATAERTPGGDGACRRRLARQSGRESGSTGRRGGRRRGTSRLARSKVLLQLATQREESAMHNYWVVGASWGGVSHQDAKFVEQGIWMLGW